jgi:hypothetical protein
MSQARRRSVIVINLGNVSVLRTMLLCLLPSAPIPPLWRRYFRGLRVELVAGEAAVVARAITLRKKTSIIAGMNRKIARKNARMEVDLYPALGRTGGRAGARCCPDPGGPPPSGRGSPRARPETGRTADPAKRGSAQISLFCKSPDCLKRLKSNYLL